MPIPSFNIIPILSCEARVVRPSPRSTPSKWRVAFSKTPLWMTPTMHGQYQPIKNALGRSWSSELLTDRLKTARYVSRSLTSRTRTSDRVHAAIRCDLRSFRMTDPVDDSPLELLLARKSHCANVTLFLGVPVLLQQY